MQESIIDLDEQSRLSFLCRVAWGGGVLWPSGKASDSGARGRGFDPHTGRRVVSLSKIHLPPKKYW